MLHASPRENSPAERPTVTVKYAQTLDGRIATASGHSQWVSGPASLALAHRLRAENEAILVGIGTILADDPQLTVRLVAGSDPLRVVVDQWLRVPLDARILAAGAAASTVIATGRTVSAEKVASIEAIGGRVWRLPGSALGLDLRRLLQELHRLGVQSVLVEGGARVVTSLLRDRLVDRLIVIVAPKILGSGIDAVGPLGATRMSDAIALADVTTQTSGDDLVFFARPVWPE